MQNTIPRVFDRKTSEELQREIASHFADRSNKAATFFKTKEEKEELKKVRTRHKRELKRHYGSQYSSRIHNLPDFVYQITE